MKWVGHIARMWERKDLERVLLPNLRERDHLDDLGVDDRMILKVTHRHFIHHISYTDWPEIEPTNRR
jgi:hypothetical protein